MERKMKKQVAKEQPLGFDVEFEVCETPDWFDGVAVPASISVIHFVNVTPKQLEQLVEATLEVDYDAWISVRRRHGSTKHKQVFSGGACECLPTLTAALALR